MTKLFSFSLAVAFSVSALFAQSFSKSEQQRLLSFGQLYSTVMYYYPDPNLQNFTWDAFAFRGYQLAKSVTSEEEFVRKTDSLFNIIAPGVQISREEFDLACITPKDTSLYPEKAFWQHRSGLSTGKPLQNSTATLNYIYGKPTEDYHLTCPLPSRNLQRKNLRISLWAKVDGQQDSVRVFRYRFSNRETKKNTSIDIKVAGNEWQHYEKEFRHLDGTASPTDMLRLFHPSRGTVFVNNLMVEVKNGEKWEEVKISIPLRNWDKRYYEKNFAFIDSINMLNGKHSFRLPAVQNQLFYSPAPIDSPHIVLLPNGYKAYIPLQLYADEKTVFPPTNRQRIKKLSGELQKESLPANQSAISYALQTWAALYHDYPYRDAGFEDKLNRLLWQTIERLETDTTTIPFIVLTQSFLSWINDPHLSLEGKMLKGELANKNRIDLPIKMPNAIVLTETQATVNKVMEGETNLQTGDVILRINNIGIDSLLQIYQKHNISRWIQRNELLGRMTTFGKPEMKVQLLRNGKIVNAVFTSATNSRHADFRLNDGLNIQEEREEHWAIQDSLKATRAVFYWNAMFPPDSIFGHNAVQTKGGDIANLINNAIDSVITDLNQYKALILDVRGRPQTYGVGIGVFIQRMDIDLVRNSAVLKTSIFPVAQFSRDSLNSRVSRTKKGTLIQVPVYVLINENTISAPERDLIALKESGKVTFIGSNTAGAAGFVSRTEVAKNVLLVYTTGQIVGLDNNPMSYQGTGISPDIYVYPTPQGIAEGRDEVLEKAVEIALENIRRNE